jgi:hypothetical protein
MRDSLVMKKYWLAAIKDSEVLIIIRIIKTPVARCF